MYATRAWRQRGRVHMVDRDQGCMVHVEGRGQYHHSVSSSITSLYSLNRKLTNYARLGDQQAPRILLSPTPQCWNYKHATTAGFSHECWQSRFRSYACWGMSTVPPALHKKQNKTKLFSLGLLSMSLPTSRMHPSQQQNLPASLSMWLDHTPTWRIIPDSPLTIPESGHASAQAKVHFEETRRYRKAESMQVRLKCSWIFPFK